MRDLLALACGTQRRQGNVRLTRRGDPLGAGVGRAALCPSRRGAGDAPKGVASNGVRRGYLGFADLGGGIRVRTLFPPVAWSPHVRCLISLGSPRGWLCPVPVGRPYRACPAMDQVRDAAFPAASRSNLAAASVGCDQRPHRGRDLLRSSSVWTGRCPNPLWRRCLVADYDESREGAQREEALARGRELMAERR